MMSNKIIDVTDIDIFYISFDEPNMEENWANLKSICPWAKRTHGVLGSDAAHKKCAMDSETDRFISVDGDNIVNPRFFDTVIDFSANFSAYSNEKSPPTANNTTSNSLARSTLNTSISNSP